MALLATLSAIARANVDFPESPSPYTIVCSFSSKSGDTWNCIGPGSGRSFSHSAGAPLMFWFSQISATYSSLDLQSRSSLLRRYRSWLSALLVERKLMRLRLRSTRRRVSASRFQTTVINPQSSFLDSCSPLIRIWMLSGYPHENDKWPSVVRSNTGSSRSLRSAVESPVSSPAASAILFNRSSVIN